MYDKDLVLLSGVSKLPQNTVTESYYHYMVLAVLFDKRTGVIVQAEVSMVTQLAKDFLSGLLVGYDLNNGPERLIATVSEHYHGAAKKALEAATRMLFAKYAEYMAEHE